MRCARLCQCALAHDASWPLPGCAAGPGFYCLHPHLICRRRHPKQPWQQHSAHPLASHALHRWPTWLALCQWQQWLIAAGLPCVWWQLVCCCSYGCRHHLPAGTTRCVPTCHQPASPPGTGRNTIPNTSSPSNTCCGSACDSAGQRSRRRSIGSRAHAASHAALCALC